MRISMCSLVSYIIVLSSCSSISMIPEYEGRIAFRLSKEDRQKIEQLIQEGKFRNISQVVRAALSKFLTTNN